MDIIGKRIFLKAINTIANEIELRTDIADIIEMYKNITYTKKDIIVNFFPNLTQQEETLYTRALQDVIKRSIGKELFDELCQQKCTHHRCNTSGTLAGKGYYNNLVEKEGAEIAANLYIANSKKGVEAKGIVPWSDEEKKYIRSQKNLGISNKEIANNCNTLFVDLNKGRRTSNGVAQRYYGSFCGNIKISLLSPPTFSIFSSQYRSYIVYIVSLFIYKTYNLKFIY